MTKDEWSGLTGIVTGAGSGIGAATSALLVELGARVVGADLNPDGLDAVSSRLDGKSGVFDPVVGDICDDDTQDLLVRTAGLEGQIDFIVNNAAVFLLAGASATREQWARTLDVNLVAAARLVGRAVPFLRNSIAPAVVNIGSISAHRAQADRWTYNSAKAAIVELTRCQALDLAPIRFNSVSPGWIWTEVLELASEGNREKWESVWGAYCPTLRCGEPEEVASAIEFLLSSKASFITGADLPVDGGYLATSAEGPTVLELGKS